MLVPTEIDYERITSLLKMVDSNLEMIGATNQKFSSQITKEYYEVVRELMSIILMLDGFKTYGEYAHQETINHLSRNYAVFTNHEIELAEELRTLRNKISYNGLFVNSDFLRRNNLEIMDLINKLKKNNL